MNDRNVSSHTVWRSRWMLAGWAAWVVVAVSALALLGSGLPGFYAEYRTLSLENAAVRDNLAQLGLSAGFHAAYLLVLLVLLAAVCFVLAALIFRSRSGEPMALFVAFLLVLLGATFAGDVEPSGPLRPVGEWLNSVMESLSLLLLFTFLYLFPDRRFAPRWTLWLAALFTAAVVPASFFPGSSLNSENWPDPLYVTFFSCLFLTGVLAQVYRYRRVSDPAQRQQTKWVTFGFLAALAVYLGVILLGVAFPSLETGSLVYFVAITAVWAGTILIPLSIGASILRYRLWDIDLVINRTLVYGLLTAALVLLYSGGVTGLQYAFLALTGQDSQVAVVASTLAIAALFVPLRRRTQDVIDRIFYRKKYDSAIVLAAFSARLRDETDLGALSEDLVSVARETLQPEHASLWLRSSEATEESKRGGGRA